MTHERGTDASRTPKDKQRTPISLFNKLKERFEFTVDIAASEGNQLTPIYMSDFLNPKCCLWEHDIAFCNPPYSRGLIDKFVHKAYNESLRGATVVCLLPADTSTQWFQVCFAADEWIIIEGRVRFNHADGTPIKGSPKFGSIVVVFKDTPRRMNLGFPVVSSMRWE